METSETLQRNGIAQLHRFSAGLKLREENYANGLGLHRVNFTHVLLCWYPPRPGQLSRRGRRRYLKAPISRTRRRDTISPHAWFSDLYPVV
jgi:hypothetical protein